MEKQKQILILATNPGNTQRLRLDQEVKNIEEALLRARQRDIFSLRSKWAVTPRTLQQSLLDIEPEVVHFCGHATVEGIMLEDSQGKPKVVSKESIADTFRILANSGIQCVVLNACYSESQAEEIVKHIPFVIGTSDEIGDQSAIDFSEGFYGALGAGKSYETAFELGRNRLGLENSKYEKLFKIKTQSKQKKVPQIWLQGWGPYKANHSGESIEVKDELLDWTDYYSRDPWKIPTPEMWDERLFPELQTFKAELSGSYTGQTIDLRSTLSLPSALAFGFTFPEPAGYVLQLKQGRDVWRSDARPSQNRKLKVIRDEGEIGPNLLAGIAITKNGWKDLESFAEKSGSAFDAVVYFEPESGVGSQSISSDAEALAYAIQAKDLLRACKQKYESSCIHLVLLAPAGFAFFLGHWLSRLGEVVLYEWNEPHYYPAFRLNAI